MRAAEVSLTPLRVYSPLQACRIPFEIFAAGRRIPFEIFAAGPVQTVRPRVSPGCWQHRRAGAARGVAHQRPGGSGAGGAGGTAHKGRLNFLSAERPTGMSLAHWMYHELCEAILAGRLPPETV